MGASLANSGSRRTAVAILRYCLYDIDFIINRALVYGALTAVLTVVYVGGTVGIGALVRSVTGQQNNSLAVAASTLAVAALFRPVRARTQYVIDRRFYRRRYDAAKAIETFSTRLRNEVELESLCTDLLGAVQETMQPAHASLWLTQPHSRPPLHDSPSGGEADHGEHALRGRP